jgi:hypothetical protein
VARHENSFDATAETTLGDDELLNLVRDAIAHDAESREAALARFLSGSSEGSAEAAKALGGSFAGGASVKRS